jgi:hypothetical protein
MVDVSQGDQYVELEQIYVRFFRSFNFDYERKAPPASRELAWNGPSWDGTRSSALTLIHVSLPSSELTSLARVTYLTQCRSS